MVTPDCVFVFCGPSFQAMLSWDSSLGPFLSSTFSSSSSSSTTRSPSASFIPPVASALWECYFVDLLEIHWNKRVLREDSSLFRNGFLHLHNEFIISQDLLELGNQQLFAVLLAILGFFT
mmetsp:Transcript_8947/g.13718  ORF Transcript_8947/g.13718 Transcript_8947/m.13718 type:complete len:120 (-) Transcript_8947:11-370(-)